MSNRTIEVKEPMATEYKNCYNCNCPLEKPMRTSEKAVYSWDELAAFLHNNRQGKVKWRISGWRGGPGSDIECIFITVERPRKEEADGKASEL